MANTYTQLHIQFVFAVKYRAALIQKPWKDELHKYIATIIGSEGHKMLQINSMSDHIHIVAGLRPAQSISSLVQNIKTGSTKWIKEKKYCAIPFAWQEGYGAFSYSESNYGRVINYIKNQKHHHQKQNFRTEYHSFLKKFNVSFDEKYLFEFYD